MKTNFLCRNALPRGSCVFLKMVVTITALLCSHLMAYAQPTLFFPLDGSSTTSLTPTLAWDDNTQFGVTKIEISECGPGTVANTIDLDGYVQATQSPITLDALEISGVTYNLSTGQLVMVSDRNFIYIPDFSDSSNDRIIDLDGFNDTEGIVHIQGTRYAVTEERLGQVVFFDIFSNTTAINYNNSDIVQLPSLDGDGWGTSSAFNDGLEGISYDGNLIHVVKEKGDKGHYTFSIPATFPAAPNNIVQADIACNVDADPFYLADLAGIHHLGLNNFAAANLSSDIGNHALMLSQESHTIVETDGNCTEYGRLCLPADGNLQLEGVTMDNNGNIYIVSEVNNASDQSIDSRLYIYTNPNFNSGNSRKVVHTNIVFADTYDVPQGILQTGVEYCWRVSNTVFSFCNWSDLWSFTPCSTGTACNDGEACTTGDVYDANCNCVGTFADADNDGVCDADDVCPNFDDSLIGTACDDGNDCTTGETYDNQCNCSGGTVQDADNDGVCDADDVCPNFDDSLIGTTCDDGNDCTTGETYDNQCNCSGGTVQDADNDGVCDADDVCPNFDDSLIGTACDDGNDCTTGETYDNQCNCSGGTVQDADNDGVCDADDVCPNFDDSLIGTACDDGNNCTTGETYDNQCNCSGGTVQDADNDGVCDADDVCPNFDDSLIGTTCDDGNDCTTGETYDNQCNCSGGTVQDADNDGVCDADDVCPNFDDSLIGTICDDGNDCTTGETYDNQCNCSGGTVQDADNDGVCDDNDVCPNFDDTLIGTTCDDGDDCTVNDVYTSDCECIGVFDQSSLNAYDCDDLDPLTVNDLVYLTPDNSQVCIPCVGTYDPDACLTDISISAYDVNQTYYEVSNTITTVLDASVEVNNGEQFTLNAGYYVKLTPGFKAKEGSNVRAYIQGCEPSGQKTEQSTLTSVTHYPNPFKDEVTLEFQLETDAEAQIIVSDVNGRTVNQIEIDHLTRGIQTHSISTQDWISGIYFYQVQIREQHTGILSHANGTLIKM